MHRILTRSLLVTGLFFSLSQPFAQSPGGVGEQSVWLKGNFSASSSSPQRLNFNPATPLDKNSTSFKGQNKIGDLRNATIFTVFQKPGSEQERPVWQMADGSGDLLLSTRQVSGNNGKMNLVFGSPNAEAGNQAKPVTLISTYLQRNAVRTISETAHQTKNSITIGELANSGSESGLIGELIVYETILKPTQITRVETYLALKYGVTLEKNYINSNGETVWDRKADSLFSHNIAGIGRDDHATLYQKQGTSTSTSDQLVIGINKIALSNGENTGSIKDRNYLLWGDNAKAFTLEEEAPPEQNNLLLSERKWLMKSSGKTVKPISTELQIETKTLLPAFFPKENFLLVIDRSGTGVFVPEKCTYIVPDHISQEGIASFSGVVWDTDRSGKDVFSFGIRKSLSAVAKTNDAAKLLSFRVYPNPTKDGQYNIAATLEKPADLTVQIFDVNLRLIESRKLTGQADYLLSGTIKSPPGTYIVKLLTSSTEFTKVIIKQ
ncbi:T9SS type A sorting domain-containing protein [Flavitalea antarctica]